MTNGQYATASKILHAMESQDFADFYGTESEDLLPNDVSPFSSYIMGMENAPSRDSILEDIVRIFHIPETGDFR